MTNNDDAMIQTPFGAVAISVHKAQLAIELLFQPPSPVAAVVKQSTHPLVIDACQQVMRYLQNPERKFNIPCSKNGTAFQQRVWQAISAIPCGQVRTYGQLANAVGSGPRAVANACGANPLPLIVPCHRVVAQNGLGGFMQAKQGGLQIKQWLLRHEGIVL